MTTHTQGPWTIEYPMGDDLHVIVQANKPTYEWSFIATITADAEDGRKRISKAEAKANAVLIKASPQMSVWNGGLNKAARCHHWMMFTRPSQRQRIVPVGNNRVSMVQTVADALSLMDDAALVSRALLESAKWQPITTAPTDDPEFQALACNYDDYKRCWLYYIINRHDVGGRYECWVIPPGRAVKPTFWMPLTVPPAPAPGAETRT